MTAGARKRRLPWAYRSVAFVLRPLLMRVTKRDWRGLENIPAEGGFVVSTNHISYVDPIVFAHFMFDSGREAYFLGKDSLFAIPVVGWLLKKCGQIPVYRNSVAATDSYRAAVDGVRAGKALGIFPEGTITRDPDLWPMRGKTGAARVALETRCPIRVSALKPFLQAVDRVQPGRTIPLTRRQLVFERENSCFQSFNNTYRVARLL